MLNYVLNVWKGWTGISVLEKQVELLSYKVKEQGDIIYQTDKDKVQLAQDKLKLMEEVAYLNKIVVEKEEAVESLKTELAMQGVDIPVATPDFINPSGFCYRPTITLEGEEISVSKPQDIYIRSDLLNSKINLASLKKLPKYEKLMKIWEYTIMELDYKFDQRENWQIHPLTIFRKRGDCEDGTILFVDACRAVGIPADQVFNVVGHTSFGYHSYPIVYLNENGFEGWYIFETTLDFLPKEPKKLMGSQYWCEGGIANWKLAGGVKPAHAPMFNGIYMPTTGANDRKKQRIDNSEEKRKQMNLYWRDKG